MPLNDSALYSMVWVPSFLLHLCKHVLKRPTHLGHFMVLLQKKIQQEIMTCSVQIEYMYFINGH